MRTDLIAADAATVRDSIAIVSQVTAADLGRPTPCARWDLGRLLDHMTAQHHGFAAAAEGRGGDPAVWRLGQGVVAQPVAGRVSTPAASVVGRYAEAATAVIAAFSASPPSAGDVLDRPFTLPEFGTDRPFPGRQAIGFHLVDYVVHGWDVARALGLPYRPPADVLAIALPIARAVPDGPARLAPGAAFAPGLTVAPDAGPMAEILARLGRDPGWVGDALRPETAAGRVPPG